MRLYKTRRLWIYLRSTLQHFIGMPYISSRHSIERYEQIKIKNPLKSFARFLVIRVILKD